jgi:starch-binding outer membrane protein, SusD/RagB family
MIRATKPWATSLVLLFALAGCEELLQENPVSFLAPENFYQSARDVDAALFAAYQPLLAGEAAFGKNLWVTLDGASDEALSNPVVPSAIVQAFGTLDFTPDQFRINSNWAEFYRTITRANIVIDRTPQIAAPEDRKAALIGEAKFLRAFSYYYLVRLYGDVPLVTSETDALDGDRARAPVEQVYAQIIADATEAASTLPLSWDARNRGRATRVAALALLADAHLTRREWDRAASFAKQVIDLNTHRLHPNYLNNFLSAFNNGLEDIFSLQARNEPGAPTTRWLDMYYPREVGAGRGGGWAWIVPNPDHVNSYIPGDYRREVSYETTFFNLQTSQWQTVDKPHTYKFRPNERVNHTGGESNKPIYRFAEVLLIRAEALNEQGQTDEAVQYLNQIRARARMGEGSENRAEPANYSGPLTQAAVREAIFQERKWELAHEGKRWFDMVRRGQEYWMAQLQAVPQAVPAPHKMLLPIPSQEIATNRALVQNPGY